MKRIFVLISMLASMACSLYAQDSQKIALSAYVPEDCGVPKASFNVLESKLNNVITACGFGAEMNQRFVLTSRVNILTEDITQTAPAMFAYTLSFDLYIGDGMTGTLFASTQVEAKGVGNTKDRAYQQALRSINPRNPNFKAFVEDGKRKIIDYYNMNGAAILAKAEMLANNQQFDEALWELSAIPEACSKYYMAANDMMVQIYQRQITQEGASMLAQAQAIWNAGQDRAAADKAGALLARINPQSPAFKQAQALHKEIGSRIRAIDNREWNFMLQRERHETEIRKAQIRGARDVAIAYAKSRPRVIYNIRGWW